MTPELRALFGPEPGGAFYLHGEDDFRKEEVARALVEAHLDPTTRDFNFDQLRGSEVNPESISAILGTPPMMAEWRVVVLRETEAVTGSPRLRDLILETVKEPPPGLAFLLLCTVPQRSSARFYKDLVKHARSADFGKLGADDVPGWLMERAREHHGREMAEDAARALAQAIGSNLALLTREMEKLSTLAEEGEPITMELVARAGTHLPRQDRWAWFDLVAEKRYPEALAGLEVLLDHGESGVGLTLGLATHLLRLGVAAGGGGRALQEVLPPHQRWLSRRIGGQARAWDAEEVGEALGDLLEVDRLLKSSTFSDRHLLEGWLLKQMVGKVAA